MPRQPGAILLLALQAIPRPHHVAIEFAVAQLPERRGVETGGDIGPLQAFERYRFAAALRFPLVVFPAF